MRTVLSEIRLFSDNISKHGYHIYMKWKEGEKEQDSRERERVCERQSVAERGGRVGCKTSHWRNVKGEIRIGL
jgi:hypothetical protein